jgi:hypothetical protein
LVKTGKEKTDLTAANCSRFRFKSAQKLKDETSKENTPFKVNFEFFGRWTT